MIPRHHRATHYDTSNTDTAHCKHHAEVHWNEEIRHEHYCDTNRPRQLSIQTQKLHTSTGLAPKPASHDIGCTLFAGRNILLMQGYTQKELGSRLWNREIKIPPICRAVQEKPQMSLLRAPEKPLDRPNTRLKSRWRKTRRRGRWCRCHSRIQDTPLSLRSRSSLLVANPSLLPRPAPTPLRLQEHVYCIRSTVL
jgi:hypothetical protein